MRKEEKIKLQEAENWAKIETKLKEKLKYVKV
jgi:hypothetical protein